MCSSKESVFLVFGRLIVSALIQGERRLGHWHTLTWRGKEGRREGRREERGEEGGKKRGKRGGGRGEERKEGRREREKRGRGGGRSNAVRHMNTCWWAGSGPECLTTQFKNSNH